MAQTPLDDLLRKVRLQQGGDKTEDLLYRIDDLKQKVSGFVGSNGTSRVELKELMSEFSAINGEVERRQYRRSTGTPNEGNRHSSARAMTDEDERTMATERELTDAKIATAEARVDTKFAELLGELRVIQSSTSGLKATILGTGIALFLGLAALFVGVLAYGSGAFYNGTVIRDMLDKQALANAGGQQGSTSTK